VPLNKRGLVGIFRFDAHAHPSDIQPSSGKLRVGYNRVEMLSQSGTSFQKHWMLWLHGGADDFQDAQAHLSG
jgi:hypothetical protein